MSTPSVDAKFDLLKYIKDGITTGGIGLAKDVGWSLLSFGIKKAVHYQSPEEKFQQEVLDQLNSIQDKLDVVVSMGNTIDTNVKKQTGLIMTTLYQNQYQTMFDNMIPWFNYVDLRFEKLQKLVKAGTGKEGINMKSVLTDIQSLYNDRDDLEEKIRNIESYMGQHLQGTFTSNLLEQFTDYCVATVETKGRGDAEMLAGSILLQFMQIVNELYKGYTVLLNLQMFEDEAPKYFPNYSPDGGWDDKDSSERSISFIKAKVTNILTPMVENLQQCTLRLVMSTYNPEVQQLHPDFISDGELENITRRMSLASWLVTNLDSDKSPLMGQLLSTYSFLRLRNGGHLHPQGGYAASDGTPLNFPDKYNGQLMPYFYKCMDLVDGVGNTTITPFELSNIEVQQYQWDWIGEQPKSGSTVDMGLGITAKAGWYNGQTLAPVTDPDNFKGDELVWMGHFSSASALTRNDFWPNTNHAWGSDTSEFFSSSSGRIQDFAKTPVVTVDFDSTPHKFDVVLKMKSYAHTDPYSDSLLAWRNVDYASQQLFSNWSDFNQVSDKCVVVVDGTYDVYITKKDGTLGTQRQPTKIKLYFSTSYPSGEYHNATVKRPDDSELFYRKHDNDGGKLDLSDQSLSLWDSNNKGDERPSDGATQAYLDMIPNSRIKFDWKIKFTADSNWFADVSHDATAECHLRLAHFRPAWRVPKLTDAT